MLCAIGRATVLRSSVRVVSVLALTSGVREREREMVSPHRTIISSSGKTHTHGECERVRKEQKKSDRKWL